jgi:hypothetical protein
MMKISRLILAVVTAGFVLAAPVGAQSQDAQPSVADAARATRKDRDKDKAAAPKTVITEDSISSGAAVPSKTNVNAGSNAASANAPAASGDSGTGNSSLDEMWARLQGTEALLDRLEPLDKSEVATTVLNGNSNDFAGRAEWEEQLFAAKTQYVTRSRQLIAAMKQTLLSMASLQSGDQGKIAPNDPRVASLTRKSAQLMQLAARTETEFQSVVSQGRSLAAAAR